MKKEREMSFKQIVNEENSAGSAPSFENGARISYHELTPRGGGAPAKYVKIQLGKNTATALSFMSDKHNCRVMFGEKEDAGQIAVQVDNKDGDFPASRNKARVVSITIKGATAARLFNFGFKPVFLDKVDIVALPSSNKMAILQLADHPEIFTASPPGV
jgi:hypothetical protein